MIVLPATEHPSSLLRFPILPSITPYKHETNVARSYKRNRQIFYLPSLMDFLMMRAGDGAAGGFSAAFSLYPPSRGFGDLPLTYSTVGDLPLTHSTAQHEISFATRRWKEVSECCGSVR